MKKFIEPTLKKNVLEAFFWSCEVFSGIENKDEGQEGKQLLKNSSRRRGKGFGSS